MALHSVYDSAYVTINKKKIIEAMEAQSLKYYWVAEMAGIHKTTLRRWLSGQISRVRPEHVRNIAQVLTLPIEQVIVAKKVN